MRPTSWMMKLFSTALFLFSFSVTAEWEPEPQPVPNIPYSVTVPSISLNGSYEISWLLTSSGSPSFLTDRLKESKNGAAWNIIDQVNLSK